MYSTKPTFGRTVSLNPMRKCVQAFGLWGGERAVQMFVLTAGTPRVLPVFIAARR